MINIFHKSIRWGILIFCLFPASFILYPTIRGWLHALFEGKKFFLQIYSNTDIIVNKLSNKNPLIRLLIRKSLRIATIFYAYDNVYEATAYIVNRKIRFRNNTLSFLPSSGKIRLISGLHEGQEKAIQQFEKHIKNLQLCEKEIIQNTVCLYGKEKDFSRTINVVIAHWDPDKIIDPYVIHLCSHFKELGWKVILSSSSVLKEIPEHICWADAIICRTCPGYDFTSWKAALEYFPSLFLGEKLILCNDSVFGPIGSYKPMHDVMENVDCDFWGITESREVRPHLQSFHLVFNKTALCHSAFKNFFSYVPFSNERRLAVECEMSLSIWLEKHGLCAGAFIPSSLPIGTISSVVNPTCEYWRKLIEKGVPLIKRELLAQNGRNVALTDWAKELECRGYPLDLIFRYFWRRGIDVTPTLCSGVTSGRWPADVLSLQLSPDAPQEKYLDRANCSIGVFIHIFYPELLCELKQYIKNIPQIAHIYVSTDTQTKANIIREALEDMGFSKLNISIFPNKGWDIAPFIVGFANEIQKYDLILKIHAKRSTQMSKELSDNWRKILFSSLIGSQKKVNTILNLFICNPKLGMLCPPPVAHYANCINMAGNMNMMQRLLMPFGIKLLPDTAIDFPMGSMFWCRPKTVMPWIEQHLTFSDFELTNPNQRDGSLAHALERLFFFGCGISGFHWGRIAPTNCTMLTPVRRINTMPACKKLLPCIKEYAKQYPWIVRIWKKFHPTPLPQTLSCEITEHNVLDHVKINTDSDIRPSFVLVLPTVREGYFSGGPNTSLLFSAELAKKGYKIHCLSLAAPTCSTEILRNHLKDLLYLDSDIVNQFSVSCMSGTFVLSENDLLCGTSWWTIPVIKAMTKKMKRKKFIYFIQDFEPLFYPWNEEHAKAILSYEANYIPIINEPYLADFFCSFKPGRFVDKDFCKKLHVFMPSVSRKHFYPVSHAEKKKYTLLFYARPSAPRNLYHYGMQALTRLVAAGELTADKWDIFCMGEKIAEQDLGANVLVRPLPWLGFSEYARHIREASVGLSLMLSPHTSYMPLELAACGVPVVTTTYANKTAADLEKLSPDIIGVSPTVEAIEKGLLKAIHNALQKKQYEDRLSVPKTWEESFSTITPEIINIINQ